MGTITSVDERELIERLRAGDDAAFGALVDGYYQSMLHVARGYVATRESAEDVVQETFLGVITGLASFEGRSSLKTWMFRILVNRARSRGERERRTTPFSSLAPVEEDGPVVDPDRFLPPGHAAAGYWSVTPSRFFELPEDRMLAGETAAVIAAAIERLPDRQRRVITLRDIEGWDADEVCESLGLSAANQRVLLHRARSAVRAVLEEYFAEVVAL